MPGSRRASWFAADSRRVFWAGVVLVGAAVFAPVIGLVAVPLALVGVLAHEHAYVQAGQSVPLA